MRALIPLVLIVVGLVGALMPLTLDLLNIGSPGVGPHQLVVAVAGFVMIALGIAASRRTSVPAKPEPAATLGVDGVGSKRARRQGLLTQARVPVLLALTVFASAEAGARLFMWGQLGARAALWGTPLARD